MEEKDKVEEVVPAVEEVVPVVEEKKEEAPVAKEVKKEESSASNSGGEDVEVPEKFKKLVDSIETMSVIELHELVKLLEKKFGVSAAAVAVAGAGTGAGADEVEEKSSFTVELKSFGDKKIAVIKVVKEILGLGLKEAKDLVDGAPSKLKDDVKKEEAEEMKAKIEEAGGQVELK